MCKDTQDFMLGEDIVLTGGECQGLDHENCHYHNISAYIRPQVEEVLYHNCTRRLRKPTTATAVDISNTSVMGAARLTCGARTDKAWHADGCSPRMMAVSPAAADAHLNALVEVFPFEVKEAFAHLGLPGPTLSRRIITSEGLPFLDLLQQRRTWDASDRS